MRDSIGGHPFLPAGVEWPTCPKSGKPMVLFFQFDVRPEFGLAVSSGSHLVVFMSPDVNDIVTYQPVKNGAELPAGFWREQLPHFKVMLFPPETELVPHPTEDPYLVPHALDFVADDDPSDPFLFVGGAPRWYQDEEGHPGFSFLCQLSENYPFLKKPDAPEQPDSFSSEAYGLFLGNSSYFFARAKPQDPEEVWITLQN